MGESTTFVAFDQHAATTVAAVLLPGYRIPNPGVAPDHLGAVRVATVCATPAAPGRGAVLLRGRPVWVRAVAGALFLLRAHPRLDPIRSDPRYWPLVERVGLADA